jgi:hypothetical protein
MMEGRERRGTWISDPFSFVSGDEGRPTIWRFPAFLNPKAWEGGGGGGATFSPKVDMISKIGPVNPSWKLNESESTCWLRI